MVMPAVYAPAEPVLEGAGGTAGVAETMDAAKV